MALLVGAIVACPINWWLVRYHLKHAAMTVRPATGSPGAAPDGLSHLRVRPETS
jgi:hypothetical protein